MNFLNKIFCNDKIQSFLPHFSLDSILNRCFGRKKPRTLILPLGLIMTGLTPSSGLAISPQELGQMVEQDLQQGQAVWLDEAQKRFFSIFTPDLSGEPKGGIIILHDADSHPNKPEVVQPLRNRLPTHGWATLAIQLPQLTRIEGYRDKQTVINERIEKAIAHMQQAGLNNLVLLGHGTGAMAASAYLAGQPSNAVRAFVAVSLGVLPDRDDPDNIPKLIERISLPILDIYGSRDLAHITNSAQERSMAARISSDQATRQKRLEPYMRSAQAMSSNQKLQGYIAYRQMRLEGASHDFRGSEAQLSKRIAGWLERHAKGVAVSTPK